MTENKNHIYHSEKMLCPFCGAELKEIFLSYVCANKNCPHAGSELPIWVWQALIDGKRAQDDLIREKTTHNILQSYLTKYQNALNYALKVLEAVDEIGGIDLEIMKIKEIANLTKQE